MKQMPRIKDETSALGARFLSVDKLGVSASWVWIKVLVRDQLTRSIQSPCRNLSCFVITNAMISSHGYSLRGSMSPGSVILKVWEWFVSAYLMYFIFWGKILFENFYILPWSDTSIRWSESALSDPTFVWGSAWDCPEQGELSARGALFSCHAEDILISLPHHLSALLASWQHLQPQEGHGWKGQSRLTLEDW